MYICHIRGRHVPVLEVIFILKLTLYFCPHPFQNLSSVFYQLFELLAVCSNYNIKCSALFTLLKCIYGGKTINLHVPKTKSNQIIDELDLNPPEGSIH